MMDGLGQRQVIIRVGWVGFLKDQIDADSAGLFKTAQQLCMVDASPGPEAQIGNAVVVDGDDDNIRGAQPVEELPPW